jgi:hypothetical protein
LILAGEESLQDIQQTSLEIHKKIMSDFKKIEHKLNMLLQMAAPQFSVSEVEEIRRFLRVGEYGLALETFSDVVVEEQKRISQEIVDKCREIAEEMQMPVEVYEKMRKFAG